MAINISAQNHSASQPWVESLSEIRQQLHYHNRYHLQALKDVQQSIDTLTQTVNSLQTHHTSQHHTNHPSYVQFPLSKQSNPHVSWQQFLLKNDLPKFDGKDPHAWIFRSQEFFEYHNVSHEQRLSCVSFMVHGEALKWFDWMKSNELLRSWDDFLDQVKFHFDPVYFEDFTVQFPKLHQLPTVAAYQAENEKLLLLTPNDEGQQHEVGHIEHPIEYSNTQCENELDVDLILEEHVSQDYPSIEALSTGTNLPSIPVIFKKDK
nr:hypothetical protein Saspl_022884 [Ipomoea trifida]